MSAEARLTPAQASEAHPELGNADWFRVQMRTGKLWAARIGGRWFTDEQAIEEMVEKAGNFKRRRRQRVIA